MLDDELRESDSGSVHSEEDVLSCTSATSCLSSNNTISVFLLIVDDEVLESDELVFTSAMWHSTSISSTELFDFLLAEDVLESEELDDEDLLELVLT